MAVAKSGGSGSPSGSSPVGSDPANASQPVLAPTPTQSREAPIAPGEAPSVTVAPQPKPSALPRENSLRPSTRRERTLPISEPPREAGAPGATLREGSGGTSASAPPTPNPTDAAPEGRARKRDRWAIPEAVQRRFVQVGHIFYFPDGARAFEDQGRRLTTPSENTEVIRSLISIAQVRGWSDVTVSGTERFRREAWQQAFFAGLQVRGYKPSEFERAQLAARRAAETSEQTGQPPADAAQAGVAEPGRRPTERREALIVGELVQHGPATYRFDPREQPSYYVKLKTPDGERTLWGKDLARAIAESLSRVEVGDRIGIRPVGRDAVTVKTPERNAQGEVIGERDLATHRNRWVVEKASFLEAREAAARTLRDPGIEAREGAQRHPALIGEYLKLRGAELIAERQIADPVARRRFVDVVREALARSLARGEPLAAVRLREREAPGVAAAAPPEREQLHVRG